MSYLPPPPEDEAGFTLPSHNFWTDVLNAVLVALLATAAAIAIIVVLAIFRSSDLARAQEVGDQWDIIRLTQRTPIAAGRATSIKPDRDVVGGRPFACFVRHRGKLIPYCACDTSLQVYGRADPALFGASAWLRFRRAAPAPGMVAVRKDGHHVMLLLAQVGNQWRVRDPNSGGGLTREHMRSLAGFTIVDPHSVALNELRRR